MTLEKCQLDWFRTEQVSALASMSWTLPHLLVSFFLPVLLSLFKTTYFYHTPFKGLITETQIGPSGYRRAIGMDACSTSKQKPRKWGMNCQTQEKPLILQCIAGLNQLCQSVCLQCYLPHRINTTELIADCTTAGKSKVRVRNLIPRIYM